MPNPSHARISPSARRTAAPRDLRNAAAAGQYYSARCSPLLAGALSLAFFAPLAARAQTPADFYKGKIIRLVTGSAAGQDYDIWARLIGRHMQRHTPGNPVFVIENMPGGGHIVATNYLYNGAPRDGAVVGMVSRNITDAAILRFPNVRYDPVKFNWLGSPEYNHRVFFTAAATGVTSARELFDREIVVGATGAGQAVTTAPVLIRNVLGLKLKIVLGYTAPENIVLAMRRGEVGGLVDSVGGPDSARREWITSGLMRPLFSMERQAVAWLGAPTIYDFIDNAEQGRIFDFFSANMLLGRPMMAPPGTPPGRVDALRRAFDATMADRAFLAEAKTLGFEAAPQTGEEIAARVAAAAATPGDIIDKTRKGANLE